MAQNKFIVKRGVVVAFLMDFFKDWQRDDVKLDYILSSGVFLIITFLMFYIYFF